MRRYQVIAGLAVAAILGLPVPASAQEDAREPESETAPSADADAPTEIPPELLETRAIDEITVTVGPDGRTAYEMEMDRLERDREAIFEKMRLRERDEEELAWRQADPDLEDPSSRIKWGYSPQAEQRFRRENEVMFDLPIDQTKPASIFRAEF